MIWINGETTEGYDGVTVDALLDGLGVEPQRRGVAVAIGDEVVPRAEWPTTSIPAEAHVEVLTAMQGG